MSIHTHDIKSNRTTLIKETAAAAADQTEITYVFYSPLRGTHTCFSGIVDYFRIQYADADDKADIVLEVQIDHGSLLLDPETDQIVTSKHIDVYPRFEEHHVVTPPPADGNPYRYNPTTEEWNKA